MIEEILKKGILIDLISEKCCPKCKCNQNNNTLCDKCKKNNYPFETLFALGYYYPRWGRKRDTQISPDFIKNRLMNVNPKYLFSELILRAKGRSKTSAADKNLIYNFLTKGLANKLKDKYPAIIDKIDFIVHVPKMNENKNLKYNNHAISYAKYLSEELEFPFERYMLVSKDWKSQIFEIGINAEKIKGSKIMIVDDIYTKGDIKGAISELLIKQGAKKAYIGVIGRTVDLHGSSYKDPVRVNIDMG